ncbi:MAG TPA: HipA domain-containing protein [Balneolaceae bacterium]|nr:HipA domain-containing protein [Balneolaceae bacterium]
MKRCPITYEDIDSGLYSKKGLNRLNPALNSLKLLPFTEQELILESQERMSKMSIQGVQPKLSARLSVKNKCFTIVNKHGIFILKPNPTHFAQVPENEDVTMRMASAAGIEVPFHALIYNKEMKLVYVIRRFDRVGKSGKIHVEDFAQVAGKSRETKYKYSMEKVATLIEDYCTFPVVEKLKLFRLTLFSYLIGNEDMHLKNFSLIHKENKIELSPAYDLLNSTIVLSNPQEELALPLKGIKSNFTHKMFFDYYGKKRLGLNEKVVTKMAEEFESLHKAWFELIEQSFLSSELKERYVDVINQRRKDMGWD